MVKPIVGPCVLYIVQNSVSSTYYDLYKSTDWEGALHMFGWFNCEFVLLYYAYVLGMSGMYLKVHRTIQLTSTLLFIWLFVYAALILCKRTKFNAVNNKIFNY